MNNLDETLVKVTQDRKKELKISEEELRRKVYKKSIHNPNMRQKVDGEMYVGHNPKMQKFVRKAIYVASIAAAVIIVAKLGKTDEVMNAYNTSIIETAEAQNFSTMEMNELKQEVKSATTGETINQISAEKAALKETGNYDMFGSNKDQTLQHTGDPNAIFNLTDLERDAIGNVAETKVEEYQGRGSK